MPVDLRFNSCTCSGGRRVGWPSGLKRRKTAMVKLKLFHVDCSERPLSPRPFCYTSSFQSTVLPQPHAIPAAERDRNCDVNVLSRLKQFHCPTELQHFSHFRQALFHTQLERSAGRVSANLHKTSCKLLSIN